ncbi:MAG TPA: type II toxin-antitoxin system RelE/ParE family toxin [Anaerohalosphaeraceae bacterium]|nr:type II toxin-antitoxin system RelE/ParE family toxin [Anaerohalosphaeraceae bacterium]
MPRTEIIIFKDDDGSIPLIDWLRQQNEKVRMKCLARIEELRDRGYELRRPTADQLERGIYELRMRYGTVNYRILYAFCGSNVVLLSHGCIKGKRVPQKEIDKAVENLNKFKRNPGAHSADSED